MFKPPSNQNVLIYRLNRLSDPYDINPHHHPPETAGAIIFCSLPTSNHSGAGLKTKKPVNTNPPLHLSI